MYSGKESTVSAPIKNPHNTRSLTLEDVTPSTVFKTLNCDGSRRLFGVFVSQPYLDRDGYRVVDALTAQGKKTLGVGDLGITPLPEGEWPECYTLLVVTERGQR